MPASEAQIRANRANAALSTGPRTPEGKETSRGNSLKHGLTGAGIVLPQREAAEVERRFAAFFEELQPTGEVGVALVRHAATMSVRMERCVGHETAAMTELVRQALAEIEYPEGIDEAEAARLRDEVSHRAVFDHSREATLARKYEAAAVRGFFGALKELRLVERQAKAAEAELIEAELGSILPGEMTDEEFDLLTAGKAMEAPREPAGRARSVDPSGPGGRVDLPFPIGRRR